MRRSLGAIAMTGVLAAALAAPVAAQGRVVTIQAGEPITIGTFGVISGPDSVLGQDWLYSVEVAVEDRGGELLGHPLEIDAQDGLCTPEGGALATQALAANPTVVGVIGSACSDETVGGIGNLDEVGLTTISPSATRPSLTYPDRPPQFNAFLRTAHSDSAQGAAVAEFLHDELGYSHIATIHDGSAYAEQLVDVVRQRFAELGGTLANPQAVTRETTDMSQVLTAIAAEPTKPEAIYFPIFTAGGGFVVDQIRDIPGLEETALIGSDGLFSLQFVEAAGPDVEGMYLSSPDFSRMAEGYADFVERYKELSGLDAPLQAFHPHGYDAANMLFAAIEDVAVQNDDGSLSIDLDALRDRIYATENFEGLTGTLTCQLSGDCGTTDIAVYQVGLEQIDDEVWPPPVVWQN